MEQKELHKLLQNYICRVDFMKVSGDKRSMLCTLDMDHIPKEFHPKSTTTDENVEQINVIRCFDLEANGWRSFRIDSVIEIKINL